MTSENETIADIVAEMLEFADTDSQSIGRDVLRRRIQHFARCFEAAWKREREATPEKSSVVANATPRNCDVGTVAEQNERFDKYCYDHRSHEICCGKCPIFGEPCCELAWSQMPYEEGGAK